MGRALNMWHGPTKKPLYGFLLDAQIQAGRKQENIGVAKTKKMLVP